MRIVVLYNPVSGSGQARNLGRRVTQRLRAVGHDVLHVPSQQRDPADWLDAHLNRAAAIVVVGGDGAVRLSAGPAARRGAALYHVPSGTENLFAREFGTDQCLSRLIATLERFETIDIDLATANGMPFVLMASIGFDAEVVHDLAAHRGRSISHLSYGRPLARQLRQWRPTALTIEIDGAVQVDDRPGMVVIANSRQYAGRLNPAWQASMCDGLLDVVFHPMDNIAALVRTLAAHVLGRQSKLGSAVYRRGASIRVRCARPIRYQLDGDPPEPILDGSSAGQRVDELDVSLSTLKLRVLVPSP